MKPRPLITRPTVSVVVPCYNYGRYLAAAVSSAIDQQPGVELEIIIADNGSTDNSLEVARELANADSRIQVLTQSRNVNHLVNFNEGLRQATGKYAVVLCADDLLTPASLTRATALMESQPDVSFTYGYCPTFNEVAPTPRTVVRSWSIWKSEEWISRLYRAGRNVIRHPEVVMRRSTLRDVGGYNPEYFPGADMLLWVQAAARGRVGRINGPDQGFYRIHGQNLHRSLGEGWLPLLKGRQLVFDTPLVIDPPCRVDIDQLISASHRVIAVEAVRYACAAYDSRDPDDRLLGDGYASFALEVWPGIENTRGWRAIQARQVSALPVWRIEAAKTGRRLHDYIRRRLYSILLAIEPGSEQPALTGFWK